MYIARSMKNGLVLLLKVTSSAGWIESLLGQS